MRDDNMAQFFDIYPDGKLISLIRDPQSWYISAQGLDRNQYGDIEVAMRLWKESAQATIRNRQRYSHHVRIIKFESLLGKTEAVMRSLASYLNITFDNILLTPTFNRLPIKANSSYPVQTHGIVRDPLSRHKKILNEAEIDIIDRMARETYESVLQHVAEI